MIARDDVTWWEPSNQLTSMVWRHFRVIQRCLHSEPKFWSVKIIGRIVFCQAFTIYKLKSVYTVDKLNCSIRLKSSSSLVVVSANCVRNLFDRSLLFKITLNCCLLISSSTLREVFGRATVVILLVDLFVIKVQSEIRGCGHTGHWWMMMGTILTDWSNVYRLLLLCVFFP